MDKYHHKLRTLIAAGSAVGFLSGWALLAHAGKPVSAISTSTSASAAPVVQSVTLPPLDFNALEAGGNSTGPQLFMTQPTFQSFGRPRLRSGGS